MTDVARLDFSGPPPGYTAWKNGSRADDRHAWSKYKIENDPPGMSSDVHGFAVAGEMVWWVDFRRSDTERRILSRAAAWGWYERRLAVYNVLKGIKPPREFWPMLLSWSDEQVAEVSTFLTVNFDVILLGASDTLTFPQVLCV